MAEQSMIKARSTLISMYNDNYDDTDIENCKKDVKAVSVGVTVDGTWQKRYGFNPLLGVVFIISVDTGEVLDYELNCKHCFECRSRSKWDKNSEKYQTWYNQHESECSVNHLKSSESMEKEAAIKMFLRSVEKGGLKYTTYIGDGDSSSYGMVAQVLKEKYSDQYVVVKEDCIGHIQKRMGSNLRKYKTEKKAKKLDDGQTVGGKGRLTKVVIDKLQNYYGAAIRQNVGNLRIMQDAIWAIFYHTIKASNETLDVQHQYCPKGSKSWCKYQLDVANGTNFYTQDNCLPPIFRKELKPLFTRLSSDESLKRCLKGVTQNQNESLNSVLWKKCPKSVFCGKQKLSACAAQSVLNGTKVQLVQQLYFIHVV